jgi:fatty acid desaturase
MTIPYHQIDLNFWGTNFLQMFALFFQTQSLLNVFSWKDVQALAKRSDFQGIKQTLVHGGLLALSGILILVTLELKWTFAVILAIELHAFFMSFLFMPLHEAVHETAFETKVFNQILALVTGLLIFRPPKHYK